MTTVLPQASIKWRFALSMACAAMALTDTPSANAQTPSPESAILAPTCVITYVGTFGSTQIDAKMRRTVKVAPEQMLDQNLYTNQAGNQILMEIGTSFGVLRKISNVLDTQTISLVISHPEMINPTGQASTRTVWTSKISGVGDLYRFDFPYAMVPGKWTFDYQYRGKSLCQQSFDLR